MPVTNCSKCHDGQTQCRKSEVVISRNKRASRAQGTWADHRESLTSSEKHFSHFRPFTLETAETSKNAILGTQRRSIDARAVTR